MTSAPGPTLLVTRQQTRFYIAEDDASKEVGISYGFEICPAQGITRLM